MAPALIVVAIGLDPTKTLIISQVVLSFILPIPVVALVIFTRRKEVMGSLVNRRVTSVLAVAASITILALNALLLFQTFGGKIPGLD
jgi:manganese transport protein